MDLDGVDEPLLAHLRDELGIEMIVKRCHDELGLAVAVVVAVGCERDLDAVPFPLAVTGCGEAAHPDPRRAVRKALHELRASRARKTFAQAPLDEIADHLPERYVAYARGLEPAGHEQRALEAWAAWLRLDAAALRDRIADPVLPVRERVGFAALPGADPGEAVDDVLAVVLEHLRGFDVLWVDLSPTGGEAAVGTAIVPRPRGGDRELHALRPAQPGPAARARRRPRGPGSPPPGAAPLLLPEGHEPAWLHVERLRATVGDLYPLYREPGRHVAAKLLPAR